MLDWDASPWNTLNILHAVPHCHLMSPTTTTLTSRIIGIDPYEASLGVELSPEEEVHQKEAEDGALLAVAAAATVSSSSSSGSSSNADACVVAGAVGCNGNGDDESGEEDASRVENGGAAPPAFGAGVDQDGDLVDV